MIRVGHGTGLGISMRATLTAAVTAAAFVFATASFAETIHFTAKLDGASETPPNASKGAGTADVSLDTESRALSWKVTFADLSGPATMAHLHGPAAPGKAAGVTVPLTGPMTSPLAGTASLTDGQIGDLRAGLWYVNVHTAQNPGGEIRGQLTAAH